MVAIHFKFSSLPLWKLKEEKVNIVSILGEGGEGALFSERWGEKASYELLPNAPPLVDQLAYWLAHKEQFCILSHLASQVMSIGLRHLEEITVPVLDHFPQMTKKWFPAPGFIGVVTSIARFLIQHCVLLLSKWNFITRYPVIFNFRVGTGRVLEKKLGTGRVPGSRQSLTTGRGIRLEFTSLKGPGHRLEFKV